MTRLNNFLNNLKQVNLFNIDFKSLMNWKYLTDPNPSRVFIYEQWIYIVFLVNLILGVLGFTLLANRFLGIKPRYRFIRRISFMWISNSILLLFYDLLRSQGVTFLSMRLFLVLIIALYLVLVIYALLFILLILPKRISKFNEAKLRDKYLHRKN